MKNLTKDQKHSKASMPCVSSDQIKELFAILQVRYPSQWPSIYPPDMLKLAHQQWLELINNENLTPDDIKRGLDTWKSKYVPNPLEFIEVCKKPIPTVEQCHKDIQLALPKPRCSKEKAVKNLNKISNMLNAARLFSK